MARCLKSLPIQVSSPSREEVGGNSPPPPAPPYGPSWVGDIIDAVGLASTCDGGAGYWSGTVIFVVWDDWGGWFDHVSPEFTPTALREDPGTGFTECNPDPPEDQWGCGYVYGFRVPLLVVSQYTKAGYVSGGCTLSCPNANFPYVHDFGSILAFTEWNFGMQPIDLPDKGYADYNAPDWGQGERAVIGFLRSKLETFVYQHFDPLLGNFLREPLFQLRCFSHGTRRRPGGLVVRPVASCWCTR